MQLCLVRSINDVRTKVSISMFRILSAGFTWNGCLATAIEPGLEVFNLGGRSSADIENADLEPD